MTDKYDIIIVGGGLAGLSAAIELEKFDLKVLILEKEDRVGGRVKTDVVDGFRLDHGFQMYLTEYPEGKDLLDYGALNLKAFKPGALCFENYNRFEIEDPTRNKLALPKMVFSPVGSFMDKIRMANLAARVKAANAPDIFEHPEVSTKNYLEQHRFTSQVIDRFFQPFFAGIFSENKLETSSRMFEFMLKMLTEGQAVVPANGMEEIPKLLKRYLKRTEFRFHTEVKEVRENEVVLENDENIRCANIIVATQPDKILRQVNSTEKWHSSATYYFAAEKSVLKKNIMALNYSENRLTNHFSEMSQVSKNYAPKGSHLVSVSLSHMPDRSVEEASQDIKNELARTFGSSVQNWKFLRNYHISHSLPAPQTLAYEIPISETRIRDGLYLAGDFMLHGSINAALKSGKLAAQQAVLDFNTNQ